MDAQKLMRLGSASTIMRLDAGYGARILVKLRTAPSKQRSETEPDAAIATGDSGITLLAPACASTRSSDHASTALCGGRCRIRSCNFHKSTSYSAFPLRRLCQHSLVSLLAHAGNIAKIGHWLGQCASFHRRPCRAARAELSRVAGKAGWGGGRCLAHKAL